MERRRQIGRSRGEIIDYSQDASEGGEACNAVGSSNSERILRVVWR